MHPTPNPQTTWLSRPLCLTGALALLATSVMVGPAATAAPAPHEADWASSAYRGGVDVVNAPATNQQTLDGTVFDDKNRNSNQEPGEPGLPGVTVSNGRDVVTTDGQGRYDLPAFDNMTVFVTQPRGYQVPVDEDNIAQFFYHHLPEGSPELKYGGIAPPERCLTK